MLTCKSFTVNPLGENCYVVSDETREAVIIDDGAYYDDERQAIADYIEANDLRPVAHLLTHTHFDHLWGAADIYARYHLAARCHPDDLDAFLHAEEQMRLILGHALQCPTGPAGEAITADTVIRFGNHQLTVIPCPGHTPGGVCFYCEEEHALFSGDSLFQLSIGRTDFPGGNHWTLINALKHLLKTLPPDTTGYPGHGPKTTIDAERRHNPYLSQL